MAAVKKIITENGITPYKPWPTERRLVARTRTLLRLHGNPDDPTETIARRYESSLRAARYIQELEMNQYVRTTWSDEQKKAASERTKAQWRKRNARRLSAHEKAEIEKRARDRAESITMRAIALTEKKRLRATVKELRTRLKGLRALREFRASKEGPIGAILRLEGAIQEAKNALFTATDVSNVEGK